MKPKNVALLGTSGSKDVLRIARAVFASLGGERHSFSPSVTRNGRWAGTTSNDALIAATSAADTVTSMF